MSEQYKNMDKLFRNKFDNFEVTPPDHVWENVQSVINSGNGKGGSIFTSGGIAGLTIFLISVGILLLYLINNGFKNKEDETLLNNPQIESVTPLLAVNTTTISSEKQYSSQQDTHMQQSSLTKKGDKKSKKKKVNKKSKGQNKSSKNGAIFIQPDLTSVPIDERKASISLLVIDRIDINKVSIANAESPQILELRRIYNLPLNYSVSESAANTPSIMDIHRGTTLNSDGNNNRGHSSHDYAKNSNWQMGVFFTPEMITYNSDNQLKNYSYSLDLHAVYHSNNLILQSGFGFSQVNDKGNNRIDFHKYLGSYEDVYDITFDTTSSGLTPVFHTQTVYVYDTLNSVKITPTKRKFTYLQIPFFAGYGKDYKRFGWFVKAGPSLSVLINEDKGQAAITNQDQIINVDNELPARIHTNWQFVVSAGTSIKLGSHLSFSFEPMVRYYLQSAYEQSKLNTRHPYSIGLKSGLLFNF